MSKPPCGSPFFSWCRVDPRRFCVTNPHFRYQWTWHQSISWKPFCRLMCILHCFFSVIKPWRKRKLLVLVYSSLCGFPVEALLSSLNSNSKPYRWWKPEARYFRPSDSWFQRPSVKVGRDILLNRFTSAEVIAASLPQDALAKAGKALCSCSIKWTRLNCYVNKAISDGDYTKRTLTRSTPTSVGLNFVGFHFANNSSA